MKTSLSRLGAYGVGGAATIIGGALAYRQRHLHQSPIVEAAVQQLRSADAVRELLGASISSTSGILGGYTDPVGGTAVLTIPILASNGARAVARVEAEAEWVQLQAEAEARGKKEDPAAALMKDENCRWLLRHLEVEPADASVASRDAVTGSNLVLYSMPARVQLSSWAPSRQPSPLPRWLRALLPEPSAVRQSDALPNLLIAAGFAALAHSIAFYALHRKMGMERAMRHAERVLALRETRSLHALRSRALEIAREQAMAGGSGNTPVPVLANGAGIYGHASANSVVGLTALNDKREMLFRAERTSGGGSGGGREAWLLTHIALEHTSLFSGSFARLGPEANAEQLIDAILAVQTRPIDMGMINRQVIVPQESGKGMRGMLHSNSKRRP